MWKIYTLPSVCYCQTKSNTRMRTKQVMIICKILTKIRNQLKIRYSLSCIGWYRYNIFKQINPRFKISEILGQSLLGTFPIVLRFEIIRKSFLKQKCAFSGLYVYVKLFQSYWGEGGGLNVAMYIVYSILLNKCVQSWKQWTFSPTFFMQNFILFSLFPLNPPLFYGKWNFSFHQVYMETT